MAKRKRKLNISPDVDKYALGDFVTQNAEAASGFQSRIDALPEVQNNTFNTGLSTAGLGASIGTSIAPGIGTAIGGGLGLLAGLFAGNSAVRKARRRRTKAVDDLNEQRSNITQDLYEGAIDTNNENPYGIFQLGGDVLPQNVINIEKGELQIDPESGRILRRFSGINPETGGLYEEHNPKGKDTENNMVSAKEGTFIVTKSKAKDYEDSINNNDKIHQNTILQNIRNKKRRASLVDGKFAVGGDVLPWMINPNAVSTQANPIYSTSGINSMFAGQLPTAINNPINIPKTIATPNASSPLVANTRSNLTTTDWGGIANDVLGFASGAYNIGRGLSSPNYQVARPIRLDIENRREILENLPNELSVNPALNNVRNARTRVGNEITRNTSNPSISRANRLALESDFLNAENQAYYDTQLRNNQIRGQRAGILSGLSEQDMRRTGANIDNLNRVDEINRQLDLAKEQQVNTGISQTVENIRNRQMIRDQKRNDRLRLGMLRDMNPYISTYLNNWEQILNS